MTQGVNPSQSPLHLEALPYRGRTSASQSSRGASTLNESGTSTFSALPSDPKTGQLDDRANTNISLRNPPQDDPWWRKTVLTLDGGGVKGYSSLLVLQAVMDRIQVHERELFPDDRANCSAHPLPHRRRKPVQSTPARASTSRSNKVNNSTSTGADSRFLPAHYFDYIGGTSTGGLIAIMLGRLLMSVGECHRAYQDFADSVFGHPRYIHMMNTLVVRRPKYSHKNLERIIKKIVEENDHSGHCDAIFTQPFSDMCRTIVVSWPKHCVTVDRQPYLFRSYNHPSQPNLDRRERALERNPDDKIIRPIWKVARATSAAPSYFKAIQMDENDKNSKYIDGGFGANNPSEEGCQSVQQLSNNQPGAINEFVSIGTGKKNEHGGKGFLLPLRYARQAIKMATDSERVHGSMLHSSERDRYQYSRFNVEHGLEKIKLDTWKGKQKLERISTKTTEYLETEDVARRIDELAKSLVQIRRKRAGQSNSDHWARFCHGVEYLCCVEECRSREKMARLDDLRQYLQMDHSFTEAKIKSLLERCKYYPLFGSTK